MHSIVGKSIHNYFLRHKPFFHTSIDKRLKWIPFATVFLLDVFGLKTKSGWKKQVLLAAATEAIRYSVADNLKKLTHERRPAPYTGKHSFPSGHTSSSFAGAEFLHTELKETLPVLSCAGYLAATATAVIRVVKNRHWPIDVIAGAAIGILSVKLSYLVINKITKNRKKKNLSRPDPKAQEANMKLETAER